MIAGSDFSTAHTLSSGQLVREAEGFLVQLKPALLPHGVVVAMPCDGQVGSRRDWRASMIARVCSGFSVVVGHALIQGNVELWLLFNAAADEGQSLVQAAQPQPAVHLDFAQ